MNEAPIGVFDSGIGGLTVVKELMRVMPGENLIYFGDTARTPYGSRSPAEIMVFMHQILHFMQHHKVKMAVIACNTMTALGLAEARKQYPYMLAGVNTGIDTALCHSQCKKIGILATEATIASGNHQRYARACDASASVYTQACPKFVPLIEREVLSGDVLDAAVSEYVVPLQAAGVDAVVLGCTHYPFIQAAIKERMGAAVSLIDPAYDTALDAQRMLTEAGLLSTAVQGRVTLCFSADVARARRFAATILAPAALDFTLVDLQDFSA